MSDVDEAARRVMRGDGAAFAIVVAGTSARLYRLAVRMTGDADEADDVLQDAYTRAHRALGERGWDGRGRLETWLSRIVVNTALDARRAGRRRLPLVDDAERARLMQTIEPRLRELRQRRHARIGALLTPEQQRAFAPLQARFAERHRAEIDLSTHEPRR